MRTRSPQSLSVDTQENLFFFYDLGDVFYVMLNFGLELYDYHIFKVNLWEFMPKIKVVNRWKCGVEITINQDVPYKYLDLIS